MKIFSVESSFQYPTIFVVKSIHAISIDNRIVRQNGQGQDIYGFFLIVETSGFQHEFEFNNKEKRDEVFRKLQHALRKCDQDTSIGEEGSNEVS